MTPSDFNSEQEEELSFWLAFNMLSGTGLGFKKIKLLYEHFQGIKEAWQATAKDLHKIPWLSSSMIERFVEEKNSIQPSQLLEKLRTSGVEAMHYFHPDYPGSLREINDPPLVLFSKGQIQSCDFSHSIGIVGTRKPSSYGQKLAKTISKELAENGVLVVSGMAFGVDSLAHWGALSGNGKTVAVLGCGVDICYPSSNKPLYKEIVETGRGTLVSEIFSRHTPPTLAFSRS